MIRPIWHVYVRRGKCYVPNVARTDAGFYLDVEPLRVAALDDLASLAAAIDQAIRAGNARVPTPSRDDYEKPFLIDVAGARTWRAFERHAACFTIFRGEGEIEIAETGRDDAGNWVDAPSLTQILPGHASAADIAHCIAKRASSRADLTIP